MPVGRQPPELSELVSETKHSPWVYLGGRLFRSENSCLSFQASFLRLSMPAGKVQGRQENQDKGVRCGWSVEPHPNPSSLTNFLHKQDTEITKQRRQTKRSGKRPGGGGGTPTVNDSEMALGRVLSRTGHEMNTSLIVPPGGQGQ